MRAVLWGGGRFVVFFPGELHKAQLQDPPAATTCARAVVKIFDEVIAHARLLCRVGRMQASARIPDTMKEQQK